MVEPTHLKNMRKSKSSQIGSFPQIGDEHKKCLSCHQPKVFVKIGSASKVWSIHTETHRGNWGDDPGFPLGEGIPPIFRGKLVVRFREG